MSTWCAAASVPAWHPGFFVHCSKRARGIPRGNSRVTLERNERIRLTGPEEDLETAREWMADNLLRLRDAVHPYLDQTMGAEDAAPDEAEQTD